MFLFSVAAADSRRIDPLARRCPPARRKAARHPLSRIR